jgi:hypothetical protein
MTACSGLELARIYAMTIIAGSLGRERNKLASIIKEGESLHAFDQRISQAASEDKGCLTHRRTLAHVVCLAAVPPRVYDSDPFGSASRYRIPSVILAGLTFCSGCRRMIKRITIPRMRKNASVSMIAMPR